MARTLSQPDATPEKAFPGRPGRPRNPRLNQAILAAAEQQLRQRGYAGMSIESVASAAGTTVPSLRRRYRSKPELAAAVIDSLRVVPLPRPTGVPRDDALAILQNFQHNLKRPHTLALLGSILAEEARQPTLLDHFRTRLVQPRRTMLHQALARGASTGQLPTSLDLDAVASLLIGSFYARYLSDGEIPDGWADRVLTTIWPAG
ncbi:MAG: TetR/AcrR family transcriptional regulator [Solirubrobacteraceae bacterium]